MKKSEDRYSYLIETLGLLKSDKRKFLYRLQNHPLSIAEGRLLRGYLEFHRNSKTGALKELRTHPFSDPFHEGVRLYLVGLVYNQHSHFRYAVENLERSILLFQEMDHRGFMLSPLYLLILAQGNRRDLGRMGLLMEELEKIPIRSAHDRLKVLHCRTLHTMLLGQTGTCLQLIQEALRFPLHERKSFEPHLRIIQIAALVKEENYAECLAVLDAYKKAAETAIVRANYAYIKVLLLHLHEHAPLYIYTSKFKDFPELHWQLETIKRLSIGDLEGARKFWNGLRKHNPALYAPEFRYQGDVSLFSRALNRYQDHVRAEEWSPAEVDEISSKQERLHFLLTRSSAPLPADRLVGLIWGEEANEKTLARLRKLISNYSKDRQVRVISSHNSYRLVRQDGDKR